MILALLILLAGQPICDPADVSHCSSELKKGEPAPYAGQLLTPDLAITLGQRAAGADRRVKEETDRLTQLHAIDLVLADATKDASLHASTASTAAWRQRSAYWEHRNEIAEQRPFYEQFWFGAVVGVGVTVLIVAILRAEAATLSHL